MKAGSRMRHIFQFHKGTIRTTLQSCTRKRKQEFQFHKGTIRTSGVREPCKGGSRFQFHKGTIRTLNYPFISHVIAYFNSIKVRLEHSVSLSLMFFVYIFQFHKGTIRTKQEFMIKDNLSLFQFHKGTIRTDIKTKAGDICVISIP